MNLRDTILGLDRHYAARHGCAGPDLRVVEREVAR